MITTLIGLGILIIVWIMVDSLLRHYGIRAVSQARKDARKYGGRRPRK